MQQLVFVVAVDVGWCYSIVLHWFLTFVCAGGI